MTPDQAVALFARNVEQHRIRQGLSQRALAERSGVESSNLCKFLNGTRSRGGTLATAAQIANGLGVALADLLSEPECLTCYDAPYARFTCNDCGAGGAE